LGVFELLFVHPWWAYRTGQLTFASGWPRWLLLVLIVLACTAIVASLSRRRYLGLGRLLFLGAIQATLAALLLILVWRPALNVERVRDRQNVLAVVVDNSASMSQHDDIAKESPSRLQAAITALKNGPLADLAKTFEVRFFAFDKTAAPVADLDSLPAAGNQSRIGDALRNVMQTAGSVPIAGVVLLSDGAENGRTLSETDLHEIAAYGIPVHAVGIGPERIDNDLELESIDVPTSVAPNATVTAEVNVRYSKPGTVRLRVYDADSLLAAQELKLTAKVASESGPGYVSTARVEFPSKEAGVRDLRFTLDALDGERNTINNSRRHVLNVPGVRRNILYVEGEPRWEFKFIRRAIENERSLRLASVVRTTQNKFYRQGVSSSEELSEGLPSTAKELFAYDALVIGSYEAVSLSVAQHQLLKDFVDKRGGGVLLLAARNGLADGGWGNTLLADTLPTHLTQKRANEFAQTAIKAQLTNYGVESTAMRFDSDPVKNAEQWQTLPDLANYQQLGTLRPGAVVLLEVAKTKEPLLVWQRYGRGSTFVFATASTQRWQMSVPAEDQRHEMFWRQLMHAVADRAPQPATLSSERTSYDDERGVQLTADVRDANFEPAADAKVELLVTPEVGESKVMAMQPVSDAKGRYTAAIDAVDTGLYRVELTAHLEKHPADKDQVLTSSTAFRRDDNVVEQFGSYQHRAVLERLASETQGRYWQVDQLASLAQAIPYTKSGIVERQMLDLWNLPIVFLVLLALKLGEWLLRLKWGTL
jgi:uncharacterized membrane protein